MHVYRCYERHTKKPGSYLQYAGENIRFWDLDTLRQLRVRPHCFSEANNQNVRFQLNGLSDFIMLVRDKGTNTEVQIGPYDAVCYANSFLTVSTPQTLEVLTFQPCDSLCE